VAIIQNGPLTNGIRGKVGDLIFQMVNGKQIVRAMPASINDPHTENQQLQRDAFKQAVDEWSLLDVEERALWDFQARLRGNRTTYESAARMDGTPKPTNRTWYDGHNSVVARKSEERDWHRKDQPDVPPPPIDLPTPPPFGKTRNLPPVSVQVLLVMGSAGAVWNPDVPTNYDGLWWYFNHLVGPTEGSEARVWVQPVYPVHRQRIAKEREDIPDPWGAVPGVLPHDGYIWAFKFHSQAEKIRIVEPDDAAGPWEVTLPGVWKWQHDIQDATFQSTKGSAVGRFFLPKGLVVGIWALWPTLTDITPGPL